MLATPTSMTRLLGSLWAGGLVLASLAGAAMAQGRGSGDGAGPDAAPKAVLELYTSQGCNSCPVADALLESYTNRGDVLALTLPVDYWDYLGWKDTLASPKFSARQRAYAKVRGDNRIYTPQMVVNGAVHVVGSSARDIDRAVADAGGRFASHRVPVKVAVEGGRIVVEVGETPAAAGEAREATIWLASVQREAEVPIRGGENRGRTLKYFNVVRELTPVGMWSGKAARFEVAVEAVKVAGTDSCAVIMQTGKGGPVIGAAMLKGL